MDLQSRWYGRPGILRLLWPVELLYRSVMWIRRFAYAHKWFSVADCPVPVVVVGNITVGGTGKTPLVQALVQHLQASGWNPAIISRGYGRTGTQILAVTAQSQADAVGDEPLLLFRRTGVPVYVGAQRVAVLRQLLAAHPQVDVVISDDGLQHLALARVLDIVLIDATRRLGNGHHLPVGPLREGPERLDSALVIYHGDVTEVPATAYRMCLQALEPVPLYPSEEWVATRQVAAFAGIGHPQRFFNQLRLFGYTVEAHPRPDHYVYGPEDFANIRFPVLMTEKDAVKCQGLAPSGSAFIPVEAVVSLGVWVHLDQVLRHWRKSHAG